MLIAKREKGPLSVFVLNDTPSMWDFPERYEEYWQDGGWTFGTYQNATAARAAMQSGTPNATATAAYDRARQRMNADVEEHQVRNIRRHKVYDESGDEADVDRYMLGDSRCWAQVRRSGRKRCLTVGLMLWMSCGNGEEDFANNVANGVALAEKLRAAGYSIRIVGVHGAAFGRDDTYRGMIHPLVEFGQPIDEHGLMAYGQPAACRHLGFSWMQHLYRDSGMGRCLTTPADWLSLADIDIFCAKQWSDSEQKEHIAKVLERIAAD